MEAIEPIEAYYLIREGILRRPELRYKKYKGKDFLADRPYFGFCYVATEVFCKLVPAARPYKCNSINHIFAKIGEEIWDLTAEQFDTILDYNDAYRRNRKKLTKRAELLYEEVMSIC